jgi:hypothetical protein
MTRVARICLLILAVVSTSAHAAAPAAEPWVPTVRELIEHDQVGAAALRCDEAEASAAAAKKALSLQAKSVCAVAHRGVGDRLEFIGSLEDAREHWRKAARLDPRLLDDPGFVAKLRGGSEHAPPVRPTPPPAQPQQPTEPTQPEIAPGTLPPLRDTGGTGTDAPPDDAAPRLPPLHLPPPSEPQRLPGFRDEDPASAPAHPDFEREPPGDLDLAPEPEPEPEPEAEPEAEPEPARPPGPRAGRSIGVGLSGGYDGILAISISAIFQELISVELSIGILYPVLDARVRFYGLRRAFSPVVGFGMTTPLSDKGRFGLKVDAYDNLYDLGETVHVDLGLSWAPHRRLEIFAGFAFVSSLDADDPDRVLFFPQSSVQALFYF